MCYKCGIFFRKFSGKEFNLSIKTILSQKLALIPGCVGGLPVKSEKRKYVQAA